MLPPELIAKLNECVKTDFVSARDAWFFKQIVFSGLVIAGLLFEGPELLNEMLSIVRSRFQSFTYCLSERQIEYAKIAAFVGWSFIIVGLLGELRASSRIVDLSASIQECSDAKVTRATLEAGDARESAEKAAAALSKVEKEADAITERL